MKVVCVPYRPDTPERQENWLRTRGQWEGWDLHSSDSDGETFSRSQACNRAATAAGKWRVAVFADSDLLLESVGSAVEALACALEIKGMVACYDTYYYLDEEASQKVRQGVKPNPRMAYYKLGGIWIGMFAIHRKLWDALGGFDERFKAWGGEDINFLKRLDEEGGVRERVVGGVYHLKHPLAPGAR